MSAKISKIPVVKEFQLTDFDPDGDTTVTFRQARRFEAEQRAELFAKQIYEYDDASVGTVRREQQFNYKAVQREEVRLTLCGSNLVYDDDTPVFKFKEEHGVMVLDMSSRQFETAWGNLPDDVATEIHSKCIVLNPQWSFMGEED